MEQGVLRTQEFEGAVSWSERLSPVAMSHVLRVHEYSYIRKLLEICGALADHPSV